MRIVIDIPEDDYKSIKDMQYYISGRRSGRQIEYNIINAILNGTPLPKGHGRLIDADKLQKSYCDDNCGVRKCVDAMDRCVFIGSVLEAPTIIEADKESEGCVRENR